MSKDSPTLSQVAEDMDEINSNTPDETQMLAPIGAPAPVAETAGFVAAAPAEIPAEMEDTEDRLAMQNDLDARAQKEAEEKSKQKPTMESYEKIFGKSYIPLADAYNEPAAAAVVAEPALEKAGFAAAAAPAAAAPDMEETETPAPASVSKEDNDACLARLMAVLELQEIQNRALLRNLTLAQNAPLALTAGRNAAIVNTTSNTALIEKGLVEFQGQGRVKAADALEGALVVLNDKASYPHGVALTGNMRDRYMLMLAMRMVNADMSVTNPVADEDLDPQTKRDVEAEFAMYLVTHKDILLTLHTQTAAQEEEKLPASDVAQVNDLLGGDSAEEQAVPANKTEPFEHVRERPRIRQTDYSFAPA